MKLTGFLGNAPLKRVLAGVQRPTHAIIISGARGTGRHTLATLFAQALVCSGSGELPCGVCPDCRRAQSGVHPDIQSIDAFVQPDDLEKDIKVYAMRDLRADAQVVPNQARSKVYIIDRPMNLAAQNTMLKLIEEPPPHAAFLLITENTASLLETVRSRCVQYHTMPLTQGELKSALLARSPATDESTLSRVLAGSDGVLGRALELLSSDTSDALTAALAAPWLDAIEKGSEFALMQCAAAVQTKKLSRDDTIALCKQLGQSLHDALVTAAGLPTGDSTASLLAQRLSQRQLLTCSRLAEAAREMCVGNVAPAHIAGWLAVKLAEACR